MDHQASAVQVIKLKPDRLQRNLSVNKHKILVNICTNIEPNSVIILYYMKEKKKNFQCLASIIITVQINTFYI